MTQKYEFIDAEYASPPVNGLLLPSCRCAGGSTYLLDKLTARCLAGSREGSQIFMQLH
jgi:hypothetical protein